MPSGAAIAIHSPEVGEAPRGAVVAVQVPAVPVGFEVLGSGWDAPDGAGALGAAVGYGLYDIAVVLSLTTFLTLRGSRPFKRVAQSEGEHEA